MTLTKKHLTVLLPLILSGCGGPQVTTEIDEFTKAQTCKLEVGLIRNELGFMASRQTILTLEKQPDNRVKGVLVSRSQGLLANYDSFTNREQTTFTLSNAGKSPEKITTISESLKDTADSSPLYGANGMPIGSMHVKVTGMIFYLTQNDLRKIATAETVQFHFPSGKDPVDGSFNTREQEYMSRFLKGCLLGKSEN